MEKRPERRARPRARIDWRGYLALGRERWLGVVVAAAFTAAMLLPDPGPLPGLRFWAFDTYQVLLPRDHVSRPAVIIAVDDRSLERIGQWPWPRDVLARLVDRIAARKPAAIGIDILFAEPDRSSPERLAENLRARDAIAAERLAQIRPNDQILADSIQRGRAVLGIAGADETITKNSPAATAIINGPLPPLYRFPGALRSLPLLDHAAAGHGLLNIDPERGIVRRIPLAAYVGPDIVLTLALEALRIAAKRPLFDLESNNGKLTDVVIGDLRVPAHADGTAWIHFSRHTPERFVSAADVLEGRDAAVDMEGRIALIGGTAVAVLDLKTTPRGERMPGVEIHAQFLENIYDGKLLSRPLWARYLEVLAFALAAAYVVIRVPRARPHRSFSIVLACWAVMVAGGFAAFALAHTLFDPTTPIAGTTILYGLMLSRTLVATELQRRQLSARLALERDAAARVAGELEGARRIQMGILPTRESALKNERRVEIFAHMRAAREVGGDLYDFFPVTDDKFLVLVGDVSDKGLPAAMFMAVSKALAKSCALRGSAGTAQLMTTFNEELSRENPEQMFVTLVALIIDLRTGELEYCNAGHEPPILVRGSGEAVILDDGGGPPLCVVDGFPYEEAYAKLEPRDTLALVSDGLTEAMDKSRALYGRLRLKALLESPARRGLDLTILGSEILAAIRAFEGGAEPADDQTLVLFLWRGAA